MWISLMPACIGKINDVGFSRSCYRMPQSQTSHQTSSLTSPEPCGTLMPQASSTPSIIIPLVYIISELRPTENKQWFCLRLRGRLRGLHLWGLSFKKNKEIYCVFMSSLLFVFSSCNLQTHTWTHTLPVEQMQNATARPPKLFVGNIGNWMSL